jgi:hypothetical protein
MADTSSGISKRNKHKKYYENRVRTDEAALERKRFNDLVSWYRRHKLVPTPFCKLSWYCAERGLVASEVLSRRGAGGR